jgi:predicted DNA binding CopG/RHH family protein
MTTIPQKTKQDLTDAQYDEYQAIAAKFDNEAKPRKDSTLNMRVSSDMLDRIKTVSAKAGYTKYQTWIHDLLAKELEAS